MPLYLDELNALADRIKRSDLTCYLHTAAPSDSDDDNGRVTGGGAAYTGGQTVAAANIARDADADLTVTADIDFGAAATAVGAVVAWSLFRGAAAVAHGSLPETTIRAGDTFKINANTLKINGTTT